MFNWALGREYVTQTPFRRGTLALIKFERENNRRIRRVTSDEEAKLLTASNSLVHMLIVAPLDTGMRRAELLDLRFGDIDWDRQLIHVRPEIAKSKKGRVVPIGTTRLRTLLEWLRVGPDSNAMPADRLVFMRQGGEIVKSFRTAWGTGADEGGPVDGPIPRSPERVRFTAGGTRRSIEPSARSDRALQHHRDRAL